MWRLLYGSRPGARPCAGKVPAVLSRAPASVYNRRFTRTVAFRIRVSVHPGSLDMT
ncbi:hypothetical protein CBM2623_A260015 [Cupriavidus taiwanensis]|nr:hypothetical protein CBM2608_A260015 [Cupriavidus taiwanensis]SPA27961.1 hypothetical protein CBM2623_A260015 [Cupriavidus taiwanensis]